MRPVAGRFGVRRYPSTHAGQKPLRTAPSLFSRRVSLTVSQILCRATPVRHRAIAALHTRRVSFQPLQHQRPMFPCQIVHGPLITPKRYRRLRLAALAGEHEIRPPTVISEFVIVRPTEPTDQIYIDRAPGHPTFRLAILRDRVIPNGLLRSLDYRIQFRVIRFTHSPIPPSNLTRPNDVSILARSPIPLEVCSAEPTGMLLIPTLRHDALSYLTHARQSSTLNGIQTDSNNFFTFWTARICHNWMVYTVSGRNERGGLPLSLRSPNYGFVPVFSRETRILQQLYIHTNYIDL